VKESAGTLLYRLKDGVLQVLIVHPSGEYNRRAPWSIPKGKLDPGESREDAARRETAEETGVQAGDLVNLGSVELVRSHKRIHGFAGPAPEGAQPRCASWEVDRAEFVPVERARELLHPDQAPFVDWLVTLVGPGSVSAKR
jgi:predicted NUDIX family NTP pyrophosphohydrolase